MSAQPKPRLPHRARLEIVADPYDERCHWVPIGWAARLTGRPKVTVVSWANDARVQAKIVEGQRVVWLWDVYALSDATPRRKRREVASV